jgi:hypothetical protein
MFPLKSKIDLSECFPESSTTKKIFPLYQTFGSLIYFGNLLYESTFIFQINVQERPRAQNTFSTGIYQVDLLLQIKFVSTSSYAKADLKRFRRGQVSLKKKVHYHIINSTVTIVNVIM